MSAIMSQNGRKIAKIMHNATIKFDWDMTVDKRYISLLLQLDGNFRKLKFSDT